MERGWEEGPFINGHPIYVDLYNVSKDLFASFKGVSRIYEGYDTYGGFWATYGGKDTKEDAIRIMEDANKIRKRMNDHVGFSIVAKPEFSKADNSANPYTNDAICLCLVPKSIADRNENCGGDAMVGALLACAEAEIKI